MSQGEHISRTRMPVQVPQWTEYLNCPVCLNKYNDGGHLPVSLACSHTLCRSCLSKLHQKRCPLDQSSINKPVDQLPGNSVIILLVGGKVSKPKNIASLVQPENEAHFFTTMSFVEDLAMFLKNAPNSTQVTGETGGTNGSSSLSRSMQRKLVSLINCQLVEEEGRARAMRAARSLGERTVTELILHHQNPQQLSANLWASVRTRGCQFLGPAMQEEVLRLILLALEDGSALSRKVLVLFVVQRLEPQYPHASKTAIGHVVQLLYRASCFKVTKREEESSLMQLKEEFRTYDSLRREHDSQIVQIAMEAGLRIAPEQWSSLLYGDTNHKPHMQSIMDKLQTPQSFAQSVDELIIALQRTGDPGNLSHLRVHLELLANIDSGPDTVAPSWENLEAIMKSTYTIVKGLVDFIHNNSLRKYDPPNIHGSKYKTSMCRDYVQKKTCPRGVNCTFAHSVDEMERYRAKNRRGRLQMKPAGLKDDISEISDIASSISLISAVGSDVSEPLAEEMETGSMIPLKSEKVKNGTSVDGSGDPAQILPVERALTSVPVKSATNMQPGKDFNLRDSHQYQVGREALEVQSSGKNIPAYDAQRYPSPDRLHMANIVARGLHQQAPSQYHPSLYDEPYRYPSRYLRPPQYTGEQYYRSLSQYGPRAGIRDYLSPIGGPRYGLHRSTYRYPQSAPRSHVLQDLYQRREELLAHLGRSSTPPSTRIPDHRARPSGAMSSNVISQRIQTDTLAGSQRSVTPADLARSISDTAGTIQVNSSLAKIQLAELEEKEKRRVKCTDEVPLSMYSAWSEGNDMPLCYEESIGSDYDYEEKETDMTCVPVSSEAEPEVLETKTPDSPAVTEVAASMSSEENEETDTFSVADLEQFLGLADTRDEDSFIPFTDRPIVSKYGPISRSARAKIKSTGPLDATATHEGSGTTPVTAVTPMERPYPITSQVPSRYMGNATFSAPMGHSVARSLPTADMKLESIIAAQPVDPCSLQTIRQRVENLPTESVPGPHSTAEREQLRSELERLDHKIMLFKEDEAIVQHQLQAIEMNIQAESGMVLPPGHPYLNMYVQDYEQPYDHHIGRGHRYDPRIPNEQPYDLQSDTVYDPRMLSEPAFDPSQRTKVTYSSHLADQMYEYDPRLQVEPPVQSDPVSTRI